MPSKSRHRKGKYSTQSKRKKGRLSHPTVAAQQQAVAQAHEEPAPRSNVPAPPASVPTSMVKQAAVRHPYIARELRTIGILAVIMLVILIVLAFIPLPW